MNSNGEHSGISSLLIATDGSVYADVATEYGAWLAARLRARITVLYVIDARRLAGHFIKNISEILESFPSEGLADRVRDYYRKQGKEALKRAASICERYRVTCQTDLKTGNVVKVVADASVDADLLIIGARGEDAEFETGFLGSVGCDLIVMGAYDNRLADSLALGTTTDYLVRNSPVPVLVHH